LFFLTNPNAPTGMLFPMDKISAFCERFEGVVLIDEAYADFASHHCLDLVRRYSNVIVSRSLSKSYSLAGLRVGFAIGNPLLIGAFDKIKDSYNLDIVAQKLAQAALWDQDYMKTCTGKILNTRERVRLALQQRGFDVYASETNFLWCKPPENIDAGAYADALRLHGVLIRYFPKGRLRSYVRISIGLDQEMDRLLEKTDHILEESHG
jgi:histidinol-phosphate aminotransferase